MSGKADTTAPPFSFLGKEEEERLQDLFDYLDQKIPEPYRVELLAHLLPRALWSDTATSPPVASLERPEDDPPPRRPPVIVGDEVKGAAATGGAETYQALFARRGDTLLKALAAIRFAESRLGIRWMTPAEIAHLLGEIDVRHKAYRSNVSNALRQEQVLVSRRARGRGFEYGLTQPGRARVDRELTLFGVDA